MSLIPNAVGCGCCARVLVDRRFWSALALRRRCGRGLRPLDRSRQIMPDKYNNFDALRRGEKLRNFRIRTRHRTATAIVAPHGGGIESGTSEIADRVARGEFSFYAFEGLKASRNRSLHITSTHFDEPKCCEMLENSTCVVCIHGEASLKKVVFLGGC